MIALQARDGHMLVEARVQFRWRCGWDLEVRSKCQVRLNERVP